MKRFFTLLSVLTIASAFSFSSGIDEIIQALKTGNSSEIAKYFDNTVEITFPEKSNSYSKTQAEVVLRDFFSNNPVKAVEILHTGENAGSQFCVATLVTKNASYRTTIYMKQKGKRQVLQQIMFELSNTGYKKN